MGSREEMRKCNFRDIEFFVKILVYFIDCSREKE